MEAVATPSDLFADPARWPKKPYCTDDLAAGLRIRSLSHALKRVYIQANPPHLRVWLILDCDYPGAGLAWEAANLPPPSFTTVNRQNAHAHIVYGLSAPVLVDGLGARDAPMRYLATIEAALRETLRGDAGFSGLITKNPAHPLWKTLVGPCFGYDMRELAEYLPDLGKHASRRRADQAGLGRNCSLFDQLRRWAYAGVRQYWGGGLQGWNAWQSACNTRALFYNGDFRYPLDGREVWWVAKSVAKYTWQRFSPEGFSAWQAAQGRKGGLKGGAARSASYEDQRASARLMRAKGMTQQAIADELGVSRRTIITWLADDGMATEYSVNPM